MKGALFLPHTQKHFQSLSSNDTHSLSFTPRHHTQAGLCTTSVHMCPCDEVCLYLLACRSTGTLSESPITALLD